MAYATGDKILASHFNGFMATMRAIYGVGSGDRGYGQTTVSQADVAAGDKITAAHWANLRQMVLTCANHQGTAVTDWTAPTPATNGLIRTNPGLAASIAALETNRLVAPAASLTLVTGVHAVTRTTAWATSISTTVDVTFASENAARYFFNSGGQLRMKFAHPTGTGPQDVDWRSILTTKVGQLTMTARSTAGTGSMGTVGASLGFFTLADTAQAIYSGTNIGGSNYSANDVTITAQRLSFVGANGGNGVGVRFVITLADAHTNAYSDSVSANTAVTFDVARATAHLTGIASPTFTTVSAWTGS